MSRENTSSVDMANGKKMAYYGNQEKAAMQAKAGVYKGGKDVDQQVINARKAANMALIKAKSKKKSKMAKASRKKNKK